MDDRCPHCGTILGSVHDAFCSECREALDEPRHATGPMSGVASPAPGEPVIDIIGLQGKTPEELVWELQHGGRFVVYRYCVSLVLVTLWRASPVYFIPHNRGATEHAGGYNLLSALAGWWGIPLGPIYTIAALATNFKGGTEVTADVVRYLQRQGTLPADFRL